MKKQNLLLLAVSLIAMLFSCSKEKGLLPNESYFSEDVIILQERSKNKPFTNYDSLKSKHVITKAAGDLTLSDFIGRSYKLEHYPYENAQNVGFPVIDIEKYIADYPVYYQSAPIKESNSNYESFNGIERYETKMQKTNTVSTGVQLDFKIFKIGSKKSYKDVFKCTDTQFQQNVFGELYIKFYDRKYELLIPMNIRKDIYKNYMHKDFVDQLYYSSIDELIKNYGGFILTKFLSGGQATALYSGVYNETSHDEDNQREDNLNTEISAAVNVGNSTFRTRSINNASYQGVYVGREPGTSISITNKFQNIKFSLRTLGGLPAYSQFTVPKDINSVVYDISTWNKSLENAANLTIAELIDESLIPISDFVEEDNLKELLYSYYNNGPNSEITYIQEPVIELRKINYNQQVSLWETCIKTRYNESIILHRTTVYNPNPINYPNEEIARIKLLFPNLKIELIPYPYNSSNPTSDNIIIVNDINQFDMSNMSKFIDSTTGKIYLLTIVPRTGEKLAYTLYDNNVVNDYIFENLINDLPLNNNVTLTMIRNQYRLIAL